MPAGRPSKYSPELAERFCAEIATTTKGIRTICESDDMPSVSSILKWLNENQEFSTLYARAKEMQSELIVDEMINISDNRVNDDTPFTGANHIQRDRLMIDTRKWIASKLKPKKYGDKIDVDLGVNPETEIIIRGTKFANKD